MSWDRKSVGVLLVIDEREKGGSGLCPGIGSQ